MSSFTSRLSVSPMFHGRKWQLTREFTYHVGSKHSRVYVHVPVDFITDFASFPLWRLLFWWLPYWAKYSKPSPLHDWLYEHKEIMGKPITRKKADDVFYEAMLVDWRLHKSGPVLAFLEYWAVRAFGWPGWHWAKQPEKVTKKDSL